MIPFIDTHCHLDLFKNINISVASEDVPSIKTITVTNAPFLWEINNKLFKDSKNIRVGLGLHPELAEERAKEISSFKRFCIDAKYIGEIGLDGSSHLKSSWNTQLKVFQEILLSIYSQEMKILTVHSRNAAMQTIYELKKHLLNTPHKAILHWFSGNLADLREGINQGLYFSVNHKMIGSAKGKALIQAIPKEKILTETDAPFTMDYKFKSREEALSFTINELAKIWLVPSEEAKMIVWSNFKAILT